MSEDKEVESILEKAVNPEGSYLGMVFKKFRLRDYATVEKRIREDFLATAIAAAEKASPAMQDRILNLAIAQLKDGHLRYGRRGFDEQAQSVTMLPFLLWVALRITDPEMEESEIDELLTPENESRIYWKVMAQMGYEPKKEEPKKPKGKRKTSTSPGTTSSEASKSKDTVLSI